MKKSIILLLSILLVFSTLFVSCEKKTNEEKKIENAVVTDINNDLKNPETLEEKASYAFGYLILSDMKANGLNMDINQFTSGAKASLSKNTVLSEQQMQEAIQEYTKKIGEEKEKANKEIASKNLEKANKFLSENAKKPGVMVTPEGVQYKFERKGTGEIPKLTDTVLVDYELKDLDGNVIDSSYERGEKAEFPLPNLIKGFQYGMKVTPVGSKVIYYISPDLGYGEKGNANVPGNSLLTFTVELHDIVKK